METRYAIFYKGENLFKDQRTFKAKSYATQRKNEIDEGLALMNQQIPLKVVPVEIESELDRYKKALDVAMQFLTEYHWLDDVLTTRAQKEINQILGKEEGEK